MNNMNLSGMRSLFAYTIPFGATGSIAANGGVGASSFVVQADSSFLWMASFAMCNLASPNNAILSVNQFVPVASVLVQDTQSGMQLMNAPVPVASVFGIGEEVVRLAMPRLFPAKTQVSITVTNADTANPIFLWLTFIGVKVFN